MSTEQPPDEYERILQQEASATEHKRVARQERTRQAREARAQQDRQQYERAVVVGEYRWLLDVEQRRLSAVRTRTALLVRNSDDPGSCIELRWRQAQQMLALAQRHFAEMTEHITSSTAAATTTLDAPQ